MKAHSTVATAALLLLFAGNAQAQIPDGSIPPAAPEAVGPVPAFTVSVNPLGFLGGFYNVEVERPVSPGLSFFVEPSFFNIAVRDAGGVTTGSVQGPGLTVGARFFLLGEAAFGIFAAPELFAMGLLRDGSASTLRIAPGGGLQVGANWIIAKHFYVSVGAGLAAYYGAYRFTGELSNGLSAFPLIRSNVGAAF